MKTTIGISCLSHDAAIAVVSGNELLFAGHAERYSRKKNDRQLNKKLLDDAAQYINKIDHIVYYERPGVKRLRQLYAGQYKSAFSSRSPKDYIKQFPLLKETPITYVDHHLSHACAGYFTSPFTNAAIVIVDAIGEWDTLSIWHASGKNLKKIASVKYPNSIGLLYSAFTQRVGFKPNEEEYIMMGMAAFGEPIYADMIRNDFIENTPFPDLRLKQNVHRGIRQWKPQLNDIENIAASCQKVVEDYLIGLFQWTSKHSVSKNLIFGGGVALNCVFNQKLASSMLFDDIWILPDPGDAGNSIGSALAHEADWVAWRGPYLGHDIQKTLNIDDALQALLSEKTIGVAHGRAEFGPRALGNRSLLADPRGPKVKDRVNQIKKRELFRPFAPIILQEHASEYFDMPLDTLPYMQFVAPCKKIDEVPAICHVDGTSRVQTVSEKQNPSIYLLLKKFYQATGCPLLLNTSLNIKGEPLVNTWEDAKRYGELHNVNIY